MICILTEKPSMASEMALALGGMKGDLKTGETYEIIHARGHLLELAKNPDEQVASELKEKYKSWDLKHLPWHYDDFLWKIKPKSGVSNLLTVIKTTFKKADEIVIATDVDPLGEGDLIAWNLIKYFKADKGKKITRAVFSEQSVDAYYKAIYSRKVVDDNDKLYRMAKMRSEFDYQTMQWTRLCSPYRPDYKTVIRQGRLKTAIVTLIGEQEKKLKEYKPDPHYGLAFRDENKVLYTSDKVVYKKDKNGILDNVLEDTPVIVKREIQSKNPPKLMNIDKIGGILAKQGFSSNSVLETYQKLYEDKYVSYPRTADDTMTMDQYEQLLPFVDKIAKCVGVDNTILTYRTPRSVHVKDTAFHGVNRPSTRVPNHVDDLRAYGNLAVEIYKIVAINFLAIFCENFEYEASYAKLKSNPDFIGVGKSVTQLGYKALLKDEKLADYLGIGSIAKPICHEKVKTRPKTPTVTWLMDELDKRDIGTGATRTSTFVQISDLKLNKSVMVNETKGKLSLSDLGQLSYNIMRNTNLASLDFTYRLQEQIKNDATDEQKMKSVMYDIERLVLEDKKIIEENMKGFEKMEINNDYHYCVFKGKDIKFKKKFAGHEFSEEEINSLVNEEKITFTGDSGKSFTGGLAEQTFVTNDGKSIKYWGFKAEMPQNNDYYYCDFNGKSIKFKKKFAGHIFSEKELQKLANGETITFVGNNSKEFTGNLAEQSFVTDDGKTIKFWGFKPDFA